MNDLISRQDAIDAVDERIQTLLKDETFRQKCGDRDLYGVKRLIQNIPPADVRENVKGEWIDKEYGIGKCHATCSACREISQGNAEDNGFGYDYSFSKYCPNCGADMRGERWMRLKNT